MSASSKPIPSLVSENSQDNTGRGYPVGGSERNVAPKTLFDLMYDGFYALFMLKNGNLPDDIESFTTSITRFLAAFERDAKKLNASHDSIKYCKYAYCAAIDEMVLRYATNIRDAWERKPLQLTIFGEQLAGEQFFVHLEKLREQGVKHVQTLEVFHMCLLLGFQGKYMLDTPEKLKYLTARVGDEIALHNGKSKGFAPFWARPDELAHKLRHEIPLWVIACLFTFIAAMGYTLFNQALSHNTQVAMLPYNEVIQIAPRAANFTITLP